MLRLRQYHVGWQLPGIVVLLLTSLLSNGIGGGKVEFRAFVQSEYRFRANLGAWANTANLVSQVLTSEFEMATEPLVLLNKPASSLSTLLAKPETSKGAIKVFYLGCHVRADGKILFADGTKEPPSWVAGALARNDSPWKPDLIIIDTCHAVSFAYDRPWIDTFPADYLFASDTNQIAWQINFRNRQPVLFKEKYPDVYQFTGNSLGSSWDGTISDLGFRLGKLMASPNNGSKKVYPTPSALFQALGDIPKEEGSSGRRLRQSNLIWRDSAGVRAIGR